VLSAIATKQAKPTEKTLDYFATQEEAIISYKTSNMILAIHSNVGYCNEKKLRS
jgi:hypothetical protein